ncbi:MULTISPECIES: class I SAM-dependent methyltransferase [Shewanella]|uniref:class I SAM-dependent methyltransferase n=1 Tax=Shewanella TaxID=22 RepID=UPI001BBBA92C|nr:MULTISPECIES: class I SAM-dependent methyltransferase [Shewanella]GIU54142.1 methylase [Shewanella sp. KT0246]
MPFSQACENNKEPILAELKNIFSDSQQVLEIGSGTGQHSVHFAANLPHLTWQASDQNSYLTHLNARIELVGSPNLLPAFGLDVTLDWPTSRISPMLDGLFSANTLHIMSKAMVEAFFNGLGQALSTTANVVIYGPFNYQGQFSSDSNASFDQWLKQNNPESGIRDIEWVIKLAQEQGLRLESDIEMPANNRLLHFRRC